MPCSCGNTSCLCGIPCCCSEEFCKCPDCALALERICKVCNKQITTERRTDEETCSCFIGEPTALIIDNQQCRLGNVPRHSGNFLSGHLVVNVTIPIPAEQYPHITPEQPSLSIPPVPSVADHNKTSLISDMGMVNTLYNTENLSFPTSEPQNSLSKNKTTGDYDLSRHDLNCEKNSEISNKSSSSPRLLQSTDNIQIGNVEQNTNFKTKVNSSFQETTFFLPSVIINNISYPVGMMDPVWRLPNSGGCFGSNTGSTLNLPNPFYRARHIPTTATSENEFTQYAPCPNFEAKDIRFFPENRDGNIQPESSGSLKIDEKTLNPTLLLQQPDVIISDENENTTVLSNNATEYKCTVLPSSESFASMEQSGISPNYSMSNPSRFKSTSGRNYSVPCPDINNPANNTSFNVYPESTSGVWQGSPWCSSLPETPVLTSSTPLNQTATSRLQQLFNPSSQENNYFPSGLFNPTSADMRNKENFPLYLDSDTTQNIEKNLKPTPKGSDSSQSGMKTKKD